MPTKQKVITVMVLIIAAPIGFGNDQLPSLELLEFLGGEDGGIIDVLDEQTSALLLSDEGLSETMTNEIGKDLTKEASDEEAR